MRVPCRRRDEGSIPRAEKFGDLITADHKVLNEGRESWHNHRYAVVVQDLATQWINLNRVKNKIRRRRRRVYESFQSRPRSQSYWNGKFIGIWRILWKIIMDSLNVYTLSLRNKRNCRTSKTTSKRGNISCIITVRSGRSVEVRLYGMLLLSAKCPRSPGRREKLVWTKIWRIIHRTNYSIWCTGGISPKLQGRQSENSSIWNEKHLLLVFLKNNLLRSRVKFGQETFWLLKMKK